MLNLKTNALTRDRRREAREGHVKMEGEVEAMPPQAKEQQEPPGVGRGKKRVVA